MDMIELKCEIRVGDEVINVTMQVTTELYNDPDARVSIERHLRFGLFEKVIDRFPPEVSVRRVSSPFPWAE